MGLFHPENRTRSKRNGEIYAAYEIAFTCVDFAAAILFVIGSILFFGDSTQTIGTWMFLIGSICFAAKPSLRLAREIHFWRIGKVDKLAERMRD
ncbi:YrhK family protein [Amaricoccus macauensis]|uniref:YrhK family protein n=1 Tax=Amaricoccus macauensis TaxID=57001 RepID=UPI003C7BC8F8